MILCSILYPNRPGARFDFDYYIGTHIPRVMEILARHPNFRGILVERGTAGVAPGSYPAHLALCHFKFDTVEDYRAAFLPHAEEIRGDIVNYTDIVPLVQFSDVLVSR